jgi:hypothetical protein
MKRARPLSRSASACQLKTLPVTRRVVRAEERCRVGHGRVFDRLHPGSRDCRVGPIDRRASCQLAIFRGRGAVSEGKLAARLRMGCVSESAARLPLLATNRQAGSAPPSAIEFAPKQAGEGSCEDSADLRGGNGRPGDGGAFPESRRSAPGSIDRPAVPEPSGEGLGDEGPRPRRASKTARDFR